MNRLFSLPLSYNLSFGILILFLLLIIGCTEEEENQKPTCTIVSPENGALFSSGDTIKITVETTDLDGRVGELILFFDNKKIGSATNSLYEYKWKTANIESGDYSIKAIAYDNEGLFNSDEIGISIKTSLPEVITGSLMNIAVTSANCYTIITNNGGEEIIERGICWSKTPEPTIVDSKTMDNVNTDTCLSQIIDLQAGTTYYIKGYATNSTGTTYGAQKSFTTYDIADIDGNGYRTVKIGDQTWMTENLKTTKFNDGVEIPLYDKDQIYSPNTYGYGWNTGNSNNENGYGAIYNWLAVNSYKLCPEGWHVPSKEEWYELVDYLGGYDVAGNKMKSDDVTMWGATATNSSGFSALPGGYIEYFQGASVGNGIGKWWSSSPHGDWSAHAIVLDVNTPVIFEQIRKGSMCSIRCVKD